MRKIKNFLIVFTLIITIIKVIAPFIIGYVYFLPKMSEINEKKERFAQHEAQYYYQTGKTR